MPHRSGQPHVREPLIALDGVGELPDAARFGRGCRPGVIDRQPRPVDCCDAVLFQAVLFCVDRLDTGKELGNNHAGPPGDRVGAGASDRPGTGKVHIIGLYQTPRPILRQGHRVSQTQISETGRSHAAARLRSPVWPLWPLCRKTPLFQDTGPGPLTGPSGSPGGAPGRSSAGPAARSAARLRPDWGSPPPPSRPGSLAETRRPASSP